MGARVLRTAALSVLALSAIVVLPSVSGGVGEPGAGTLPGDSVVRVSGSARLAAVTAGVLPLPAHPQIAVGGGHTCALDTVGAVRCWGANTDGQLGDGTTINHQRPALVAGLDSGVVAVAAGFSHTCALTTAGGVKCWGTNADGELGDFTQVERTTPVDVINLASGVVAISAGDRHTCALLATGGMACWGYNVYGEVGNGTSGNSWLGAVDVCASGSGFGCVGGAPLTGIASMSAGGINTCAVTTAGALKCWGGNYSGQLGQGFAPDSPLPPGGICPTSAVPNASCVSLPADVPSLQSGIAAVDAGQITCALTTAGGVKCWGYNYWGDVGDGTRTTLPGDAPNYAVSTPVDVTGLASGVDAVSRPCALLASGGVKCWGSNAFGQIGDGTTAIRPSPVDVFGLSSGVASISGGGHVCVVMAAGGLKCWGQNGAGQLGAPTTETCSFGAPCSTVPVDVSQCTVCVLNVSFEHQVYPDEVNWAPVGAQGTIDGNRVRVKATVQNQAGTDRPVTVEFRDVDTGTLLPGGSIDGTVPASGELPITYVWNTDGFAWDGGVARSPRHVRVTVLEGATTQDTDIRGIKIVPKPVVLVHGYASSAATWSAYQGFLSASSPDWKAFAVGDGAVPGREDTGALPPAAHTNTIDENAHQVDLYIEGVRKLTNAWHVDIVAHSMGGLISRYYIQNVMGPDAYSKPVVSHLIMLGTPNHGTICADLIFMASGTLANFPATLQNTTAYVSAIFDTQVTNRRGVPFSISAGYPVSPCLIGLLPGDGITGVLSAVGVGGDASPLFGISDYETRFIHHLDMTSSRPTFDEFVKPRLVAPPPPAPAAAFARNVSQASAAAVPAMDTSPQLMSVNGLQLSAGGVADLPFAVTDGTEIGVTMITAPAVSSELRDPNGVVVSAIAAGSPESMLPFRTLSASAPITGTWTLHLANTGSEAASVAASAWVQGSAIQLTLGLGTPAPDGATPLTATLMNNGAAVTGATVTATLTGADGPHGPTTLVDDGLHGDGAAGDGVYGGTTGALSAGLYAVVVQATASSVVRYTTGVVEIASVAATPTSTATATPTASATPTPTATTTSTPTPTDTPAPTATDTAVATNTAAPTATDTPTATATPTATSATPTNTPLSGGGLLLVPNWGANSITAYDTAASGDAPPLRTITGLSTGLNEPLEVFLDAANHEIFVSNRSGPVTVYGEAASGNVGPLRTFAPPSPAGSIGTNGIDVDSLHDEVFVARANAIRVYSRSASGSDAPLRTLSGPATTIGSAFDVFVDTVDDELYVVDEDFPYAISVFSRTASGDTPPLRRISGVATELRGPFALFVDTVNNEIVVANSGPDARNLYSVVVYSRTADGDVAPLRTLKGPDTGLRSLEGVFVDNVNDELYVASATGGLIDQVVVFCRTASGNTTPDRVLEGAATGLNSPARLWVSPVRQHSLACERSAPTPTATATPTNTSVATATNTPTATASAGCGPLVVNSTADAVDAAPGNCVCATAAAKCTLRAAIMEANASPGADTIILPAGTYTLSLTGPDEDAAATGDLDITGDVTIDGAGAATTIIDGNAGNPRDRVFHLLGAPHPQVRISGVTITGGSTPGNGGGIYNDNASLTLRMDEIRSNRTNPFDGGSGGGIYNLNGSVTIDQSTIDSNTVSFDGDGGGIANVGGTSATLYMSNDTVRGNSAFIGGGVFNLGGHVSLRNMTVSNNAFTGGGEGGGVDNFAGVMDVANTLFADNRFNCGRLFTSLGHNLDTDGTCGLRGPGDISPARLSIDALLGPLQDNGGTTRTIALLAGSPAIDAADAALCPAADQRGVTRPQDGDGDGTAACDIGAFELELSAPATGTPTPTSTAIATATDTPTPTATAEATATDTPTPTPTATAEATATSTAPAAATSTSTATATATPTSTATSTPTATATNTPTATSTPTPTATSASASGGGGVVRTSTPVPTSTAPPAASPTTTAVSTVLAAHATPPSTPRAGVVLRGPDTGTGGKHGVTGSGRGLLAVTLAVLGGLAVLAAMLMARRRRVGR